jgi:hypothetical protein
MPVPESSLLRTHRDPQDAGRWDHYADCYGLTIDRAVPLPAFVYAFYTSPVFRLERTILRHAVKLPSTDDEARELAAGTRDTFAAWRVGARTTTQLLMCDRYGSTRSWFAVTPLAYVDHPKTLLQFGSGVATPAAAGGGRPRRSQGFRLLLGFHDLYSRVLLSAARGRLSRSGFADEISPDASAR